MIGRHGDPVRRRFRLADRLDSDPRLLAALEWARAWLPGDSGYGDPLSTGDDAVGRLAAQLAPLAATRPSVLRELGLTALQVWQAHAGVDERPSDEHLAVLFTDLAGFSDWTLEVGDDVAVRALRRVGAEVEPLVRRRGRVVKRLGDGLMAVLPTAEDAVEAALAARDAVEGLEVDGHHLHLRAGVHVGRPQQLGGDYYGRDVNIAARITDVAGPGEVCVSSTARAHLDGRFAVRARPSPRGKGVPPDITPWWVDHPSRDAAGSPAGRPTGPAVRGWRR
ncbi:adenylate/guanylate cyclase domain-containing protein [Actinomycetospora cinnamomea]|uniref:Adenylate cyclase n=1 Tax=Actinomycetospora cinnamomea TaxID=663609 RepID=A0A2U1F8P3_9PSEU|nr:adenylate/guanylate cyclase domain-containing protein [Actinomycetospora cinnamomea]PVZ08563.1 adenylate cyclase [Actinomycetospora cinnamomea]